MPSIVVHLGNHQPIEILEDPAGTKTRHPVAGNQVTTVIPPDNAALGEMFRDITHPSLWASHSDAPTPVWVSSTDPDLGRLLAKHWYCELRDAEQGISPC